MGCAAAVDGSSAARKNSEKDLDSTDEDELKEPLFAYFSFDGVGRPKDNSKSTADGSFSTSAFTSGGGGPDSSVVVLLHLVLSPEDELSITRLQRISFVASFIDVVVCGGVERRKSRQALAGRAGAGAVVLKGR